MRKLLLIGTLAVLASGGSLAIAVFADASDSTPPPQRPAGSYVGEAPAPADQPESMPVGSGMTVGQIVGEIGAIRRSRALSDDVTAAVRAMEPIQASGADFGAARRVSRASEPPMWIAPSKNGEAVCLFGQGEAACPLAKGVKQQGLSVALFKHVDTPWRVTGIAADSISAVTIVKSDGSTVDVPVTNNTFLFEDSQPPRDVRWVGPNGPMSESFPM
jgi:hypothetical protein